MKEGMGLSRPGAMQMVTAALLMAVESCGPIFIAATRPTHPWEVILTGFPALLLSCVGLAALLLYVVGFLRYCSDKGYSPLLAFCLLLSSVPGFIALLLLPDKISLKPYQLEAIDKMSANTAGSVK